MRKQYIQTFDFRGMKLVDALRLFLESFRLPGESQKIERLVETFAARYFEQEPGPMHNSDTVFILSYRLCTV